MRITPHQIALRDGMPLTLRSPEAADGARVLAHRVLLTSQSSANLNGGLEEIAKLTIEQQSKMLGELADHPRGVAVMAAIGDQVLGIAIVHPRDGWSAHVGDLGLGVLETQRGKGLGRALMTSALDAAERAGIWNVVLTVRSFNAPAIDLYESAGFYRVGHLKSIAQLPDRNADEYIYQRIRRRASGSFAIT